MTKFSQGPLGAREALPGEDARKADSYRFLEIIESGRVALREELSQYGFSHAGRAEFLGCDAEVLLHRTSLVAVVLLNDIAIPGRHSLGAAGNLSMGEQSIPAVLLPDPSREALLMIMQAASTLPIDQAAQTLAPVLKNLLPQARLEVFKHELEHAIDTATGSPWASVRAPHDGAETDETRAGRLLMELRAFRHNVTTDPARARVAIEVCEVIERALHSEGHELIPEALLRWQAALKGEFDSYDVGGEEVVVRARDWLVQHGTLHPHLNE